MCTLLFISYIYVAVRDGHNSPATFHPDYSEHTESNAAMQVGVFDGQRDH